MKNLNGINGKTKDLKMKQQEYNSFLKIMPRISVAVLILVIGIFIAGWLTSIFKKRIKGKSHDPLMIAFLAKAIKLILIICIFFIALHTAGLSDIAGALITMAGTSAVLLGFAFKDIAENFLAGIILAFNRPFNMDDTVQIGDVFGKIKAMEFRYTKITTFDGKNVYIPNSDVLKKPVFNYTEDGYYRSDFIVGIAYENNIEKAKEIIATCFEENERVVKDALHVNFTAEDELAPSTVNLKVYFWITTEDFRKGFLQTKGLLIQQIKVKLEANGFNLPANITELKFYEASKSFPINADIKNKSEAA
jgi:small-conductance mechanosensitive channel